MFRTAIIISMFLSAVSFASNDIANSARIMQDIEVHAIILNQLKIEYNKSNDNEYRQYIDKLIEKQKQLISNMRVKS